MALGQFMTNTTAAAGSPGAFRLTLILILFAASGGTALIYEVVWYQLLQLVIGASAISLAILLATFMGGLCLGSWLVQRLPRTGFSPLRVYALIELGIGLCGVAVLWGMPLADHVYVAGIQQGLPSVLLRGAVAALCLLPPTLLMGASLPVMARYVQSTRQAARWWGWLYAANSLGAVIGCLSASFYLLRLHDMAIATYAAVGLNVAIALVALILARTTTHVAQAAKPAVRPAQPGMVHLSIALSGATALAAETVWTRQLGMMFDGTVYAFSIILAVFLIGIALGSFATAYLLRSLKARPALGWSQMLLAAGIAWAAYFINKLMPSWPMNLSGGGWAIAADDLEHSLAGLLPAAILWGVSFPLAMAAADDHDDPARPVGLVYAANTLGGVIGALATGLVLISWIGTTETERLLVALAALSGAILLLPELARRPSLLRGGALAAGLAAAALLAWRVPQQPGNMIAYGRQMQMMSPYSQLVETAEGRNSSVAITRYQDSTLQISVAGHVEASNNAPDMRLQRMVGHVAALLHPHPVKVLGIGFGAGVSAGSFTPYPSVASITICELEPKVPPLSTKYFAPFDNNVKNDPRTHIVFDDGRHFLLTTKETFDIIASDPLDVWVKGTATIYSADYFETVKRHLNPGGYFTLYVPLYESDEATVKSEIATFFEVFPHGTIWANTIEGQGYDLVLMGQAEPLKIDLDAVEHRLAQPDYAKVAASMHEIGFYSATEMYSTFAGQQSDLADWLKDAQLNTDRDLRLMYLAGWGINSHLEGPLYRKIVSYRHAPDNLFSGSPASRARLYSQMGNVVQGGAD